MTTNYPHVYRGYSIDNRNDSFVAVPVDDDDDDITIVGNSIEDMYHYIDLLWQAVDSPRDQAKIPEWMRRWLNGEETIGYPGNKPKKNIERAVHAIADCVTQMRNCPMIGDCPILKAA